MVHQVEWNLTSIYCTKAEFELPKNNNGIGKSSAASGHEKCHWNAKNETSCSWSIRGGLSLYTTPYPV